MKTTMYIIAGYIVMGFIFMTRGIKAGLGRLFPIMIITWPIIPYMAVCSLLDRIHEKHKLTFWFSIVCLVWPAACLWFLIISQDKSGPGFIPLVMSAVFGLMMVVSLGSLIKWAWISLFRWLCNSIFGDWCP